jgi:hypothetical protein
MFMLFQWKSLYLSISPDKFHYLKSILEGYDGLAVLSSVNGKNGLVRLRYPVDSEHSLFALLSALAPKLSTSLFC